MKHLQTFFRTVSSFPLRIFQSFDMPGRGRGLTLPAWMTQGITQTSTDYTTNTSISSAAASSVEPKPQPIQLANPVEQKPQPVQHVQPSYPASATFSAPIQQPIVSTPVFPMAAAPVFTAPLQQPTMNGGFAPTFAAAGFPGNYFAAAPMAAPLAVPKGPAPPTAPAPVIGDPNNNASYWGEHVAPDGRKYWYNRVSLVSTYDKPFCLKTPEERSIPPCPWKEYSADGKIYYSNGTESTWTMPEEYRVWREKIDAIELKKKAGPQPPTSSAPATKTDGMHRAASTEAIPTLTAGAAGRQAKREQEAAAAAPVAAVEYGSPAEAAEAFKEMLLACGVSTTAKMKEVVDLCAADPRWEAVKSQGEKKQCLAEYQTKLLKVEREQQKARARKCRDAFLLMLAENTDIDARTRWRDAVQLLQEDGRYKGVEDPREREDLFKDFTLELEKKEKEDARRARDAALGVLTQLFEGLRAEGKLDRRSIWVETRRQHLADAVNRPELRTLDDTAMRRCFQDFVSRMEEEHRQKERARRDEHLKLMDEKGRAFRAHLDALVRRGVLNQDSRWKELVLLPELAEAAEYKELCAAAAAGEAVVGSVVDPTAVCREVFERVLVRVQEDFRADKRLVRDLLHEVRVRVSHDSRFEDLRALALRVGRMKEVTVDGQLVVVPDAQLAEEGEEIEDPTFATGGAAGAVDANKDTEPAAVKKGEEKETFKHGAAVAAVTASSASTVLATQLRAMMIERPLALSQVFAELQERARADHAEELRAVKKAEDRFTSLLQDSFYSAAHVGIEWEEAKRTLQKRSAYDLVGKTERRRLFSEHMADLSARLEAKNKAMQYLGITLKAGPDAAAAAETQKETADGAIVGEMSKTNHHKAGESASSSSAAPAESHRERKRHRSPSPAGNGSSRTSVRK